VAEIDLNQIQSWLEARFTRIDGQFAGQFAHIEERFDRLEDRMTILEHAFVGLAAQLDIRRRAVEER
jgi:hypothetical protein